MHALNDLVPTLAQLQNTVAWAVLVLLVSAALGAVWWAAGRLLLPRARTEDWRQWAEDRRQTEHATRRRR